jgi:hypothetical protein
MTVLIRGFGGGNRIDSAKFEFNSGDDELNSDKGKFGSPQREQVISFETSNLACAAGSLKLSPHRQLQLQLEMLVAMSERPAHPGLEAGLIVGHAATARQPIGVEPLERAEFRIEPAANLDLGHGHRRKVESADFAVRRKRLGKSFRRECAA